MHLKVIITRHRPHNPDSYDRDMYGTLSEFDGLKGLYKDCRIIALEGISGSGKTAASIAVARELGTQFRVLRLSFPALLGQGSYNVTEILSECRTQYKGVTSAQFRALRPILDAAIHLSCLASLYTTYDILIFDGWLQNSYKYSADISDEYLRYPEQSADSSQPGAAWGRRLVDSIPKPDVIFYLKADPQAAAVRVARRKNRTARSWNDPQLLAELARLDAGYWRAMARWPGHILDANAPLPQVVEAALDRIADLLPPASAARRVGM
jgi:thymidylate kinase